MFICAVTSAWKTSTRCHLVFSYSEKCEVLQYSAWEAEDAEKVRKWLEFIMFLGFNSRVGVLPIKWWVRLLLMLEASVFRDLTRVPHPHHISLSVSF